MGLTANLPRSLSTGQRNPPRWRVSPELLRRPVCSISRVGLQSALAMSFFPKAALAACVFGLSTNASAYCRTMTCKPKPDLGLDCPYLPDGCQGGGVPIAWPGRCVSYSVAVGSHGILFDQLAETTERAFATWRNVICSDTNAHPSIMANNTFGPTTCINHEYNTAQPNANSIIYREGPWPYLDATNALALTSVTFDTSTGTIFDADIEINGSGSMPISTSDVVPPDSYDLQSILTHETGHFLGLAHSTVQTATMWWEYSEGNDAYRELTPDDTDGLCAIYPTYRDGVVCDYTPRQGFSPECRMDQIQAGMCSTAPHRRERTHAGAIALALAVRTLTRWRRSARQRNQRAEPTTAPRC